MHVLGDGEREAVHLLDEDVGKGHAVLDEVEVSAGHGQLFHQIIVDVGAHADAGQLRGLARLLTGQGDDRARVGDAGGGLSVGQEDHTGIAAFGGGHRGDVEAEPQGVVDVGAAAGHQPVDVGVHDLAVLGGVDEHQLLGLTCHVRIGHQGQPVVRLEGVDHHVQPLPHILQLVIRVHGAGDVDDGDEVRGRALVVLRIDLRRHPDLQHVHVVRTEHGDPASEHAEQADVLTAVLGLVLDVVLGEEAVGVEGVGTGDAAGVDDVTEHADVLDAADVDVAVVGVVRRRGLGPVVGRTTGEEGHHGKDHKQNNKIVFHHHNLRSNPDLGRNRASLMAPDRKVQVFHSIFSAHFQPLFHLFKLGATGV